MKAKERIKRYGLERYIRVCLHKEPTPELIAKYKKKYGDWIPEKAPIRYQVTFWNVWMEDEITGEIVEVRNLQSKLHREPDVVRDLAEVERKAQGRLGGSEWHLIDAEYLGKKYYWIKGKERELEGEPIKTRKQVEKEKKEKKPKAKKERKPAVKPKEKKEKKEIISAEQVSEVVKGMRMAGMTPEEIGRALRELLKE